jgi:hypothetical protein
MHILQALLELTSCSFSAGDGATSKWNQALFSLILRHHNMHAAIFPSCMPRCSIAASECHVWLTPCLVRGPTCHTCQSRLCAGLCRCPRHQM